MLASGLTQRFAATVPVVAIGLIRFLVHSLPARVNAVSREVQEFRMMLGTKFCHDMREHGIGFKTCYAIIRQITFSKAHGVDHPIRAEALKDINDSWCITSSNFKFHSYVSKQSLRIARSRAMKRYAQVV